MAKRIVLEEITCDGRRGCEASSGLVPLREGRLLVRKRGWLILPEIDLCPACRKLPDFVHLNFDT